MVVGGWWLTKVVCAAPLVEGYYRDDPEIASIFAQTFRDKSDVQWKLMQAELLQAGCKTAAAQGLTQQKIKSLETELLATTNCEWESLREHLIAAAIVTGEIRRQCDTEFDELSDVTGRAVLSVGAHADSLWEGLREAIAAAAQTGYAPLTTLEEQTAEVLALEMREAANFEWPKLRTALHSEQDFIGAAPLPPVVVTP